MKIITENKLPIKSWCDNPEASCIEQANHLADLPFAFKQICLMPDTHMGYGMPIGGVLACTGVIIPNAVGVDIGCSVSAYKTDLSTIETSQLKVIMDEIRQAVPFGEGNYPEPDLELATYLEALEKEVINGQL